MYEDVTVRIPQEIAFTSGGLIRVALFAALGFGMMAWAVDERSRILTVAVGAFAMGAIALALIHLRLQQRYGTAILIAARPFVHGKPFAGTIVTERVETPRTAVRIRMTGTYARREETLTRTSVDPMFLRRGPEGSLVIPFLVPPPDPLPIGAREVRLRVRTAHWPVGWGATFVIAAHD